MGRYSGVSTVIRHLQLKDVIAWLGLEHLPHDTAKVKVFESLEWETFSQQKEVQNVIEAFFLRGPGVHYIEVMSGLYFICQRSETPVWDAGRHLKRYRASEQTSESEQEGTHEETKEEVKPTIVVSYRYSFGTTWDPLSHNTYSTLPVIGNADEAKVAQISKRTILSKKDLATIEKVVISHVKKEVPVSQKEKMKKTTKQKKKTTSKRTSKRTSSKKTAST